HDAWRGKVRLLQPVRGQMSFEMIDADQGNAQGIGRGLAITHADEERPRQPRSACDCDRADIAPADLGARQGFSSYVFDGLNVASRRQFGYDPAEPAMDLVLRRQHAGDDVARWTPDGGCRFIAG